MSGESKLPANGRLIAVGLTFAAAVGLLLNHFLAGSQNIVKLMILCIGPIGLFLGIGGILEPKILFAVGKYGKHLPAIYKVIGGMLGTLGVIVTILLLVFVYPLGSPEPRPTLLSPNEETTETKANTRKPVASGQQEEHVVPQEVTYLTYARPDKRWVPMNNDALQGISRERTEGGVAIHYVEGEHALLKVLWPDVLEIGDRFTVEIQGANSVELVDLEGADANARTSAPVSDTFVLVEIWREQDQITFTCDGKFQKAYYASGGLRGNDAKAALLATALRPAFTVKKGGQASFRNASIVKAGT